MIINPILKILGTILFFAPGILIDLILFKKSSLLKRTIFSIAFSASIATIIGMLLAFLSKLKLPFIIISFIFLTIILLIFFYNQQKKEKTKTLFSKSFLYILGLSLIGTIWRIFLKSQFQNFGDAYGYASYLIYKSISTTGSLNITIPNLNFYTGMVKGHAHYVGGTVAKIIWDSLTIKSSYLCIFLGVLMYVGFVFLTTYALSQKKELAILAASIMTLGPVEIWRTTLGFFGHPLSYIAVFSLFLVFISPNKSYFWSSLIICSALILTYYTGAIIIIIISIGFLISILLLYSLGKKEFIKEFIFSVFRKKSLFFILLILISSIFVFQISNASDYTKQNIKAVTNLGSYTNTTSTMVMPKYHYTGPFEIFGFPIIAIEDLIFLLCGLTFIIYFIFIKRKKQNIAIALSIIPVALLSFSFLIVNSPERIFYYFTFFAIAGLKVPKKYLKYIAIFLILITIIFAGIRIYERPFLEKYNTEIQAAEFAKQNLNKTIFTDQHFTNILILNDYYNVQGIDDTDLRIIPIYRENNLNNSILALNSLDADYIAITKRMQETYILSLNFPQKPMNNIQMYEDNYKKIYDNNDVKIYELIKIQNQSLEQTILQN